MMYCRITIKVYGVLSCSHVWHSKQSLLTGNPNISLASIDPLRGDLMRVTKDTGPVVIDANMTNFELSGFSKGKFLKFRGFDENLLEIRLTTKVGNFKGPYNIVGKILIIPVNGEGVTDTTFCK